MLHDICNNQISNVILIDTSNWISSTTSQLLDSYSELG